MEHYKEIDRKSTFCGTGFYLTCESWKIKGADSFGQYLQ